MLRDGRPRAAPSTRRRRTPWIAAILGLLVTLTATAMAPDDDPFAWLEAVDDQASMDWVRARNAVSTGELEGDPAYAPLHDRLLAIFDSKERIPAIEKIGPWFYNFWRDADHVRGVMRRTTLDANRQPDPRWEIVIDLDALSDAEHENWVWKGWNCRYPDYGRCIVSLSRGGGDAVVVREFDLVKQRFVPAEDGGFQLPEAKGSLTWIDPDHVFASTDFGPGSLTDSGYPKRIKRWTRGTPLASATEVFAARKEDVGVGATRYHLHIGKRVVHRTLITRAKTFFTNDTYLLTTVEGRDRLTRLDMPDDARARLWGDQLLITLRGTWPARTHGIGDAAIPSGALLAIDFERFMEGARDFATLFSPGPRKALGQVVTTRDHLLINAMSDVQNHVSQWTLRDGRWTSRALDLPTDGTVAVSAVDDDTSDDYFVQMSNALQPTTLAYVDDATGKLDPLKALPSFFDATGMRVEHREARSADGTMIPYVMVLPKGFQADGLAPTILYGYGGFEIPMLPRSYSAVSGSAWLERGGVFVVAGIRGGGEFGPRWHEAALKADRQRAYDDFIAVAEDLIATHVTSAAHLGIMGGSNGGLLVGAVAMERPELFKAVVCQVPLLDMRRYNKLLAGASWMGEYGDPDIPEQWAYISKYSPYQNVFADKKYPRILFTTSTRDDRVHPGHARKMAAKMLAQKHDILYFENTEGGHAGAANNRQQAMMNALEYTFMMRELR
jgi:prolyl oligopeptidase